MKKKVFKLTESQLINLVKRIINERDDENEDDSWPGYPFEIYKEKIDNIIERVIEDFESNFYDGQIEYREDVEPYIEYMETRVNELLDDIHYDDISHGLSDEIQEYATYKMDKAIKFFDDMISDDEF